MKKVNIRTMISVAVFSLYLAGCGGEGKVIESVLSNFDDDIKAAEKNRSSTVTFINATNDMANFYARPLGIILDEVYESEYEVASLLKGEVSEPYIYRWNEHLSTSEFAIADSASITKKDKMEYTLENNNAYWGIAWIDNNKYSISILNTMSNPDNNSYSIRFFSMSDQNIFIGESNAPLIAAQKGEVTPVFTYNNCADIDTINNKFVDFCQIANMGESYLAVIGENGEIIIGQE